MLDDPFSFMLGDPLSEEDVMMLIKKADKDGDGWLNFDEFLKVMIGT